MRVAAKPAPQLGRVQGSSMHGVARAQLEHGVAASPGRQGLQSSYAPAVHALWCMDEQAEASLSKIKLSSVVINWIFI